MFWERFYNLCVDNGTKPNPLAKEIGISSGLVTKWKMDGTLPSGEMLVKIANYFGCSVDYLLGRTDTPQLMLSDDTQAVTAFFHINLGNDWNNFPLYITRIPSKGDTVSFSTEGPIYEVDRTLFNYFECMYPVEVYVHQVLP